MKMHYCFTAFITLLSLAFALDSSRNQPRTDTLKTIYFDSITNSANPDGSQDQPFKSMEEFMQQSNIAPDTDNIVLSFASHHKQNSTEDRYIIIAKQLLRLVETNGLKSLKITSSNENEAIAELEMMTTTDEEVDIKELNFELSNVALHIHPREFDFNSFVELKPLNFIKSTIVFQNVQLNSSSASIFSFTSSNIKIINSVITFSPTSLNSCMKVYQDSPDALLEHEFPLTDYLFNLMQSSLEIRNLSLHLVDSPDFKSCALTFFQGSGQVKVEDSHITSVLSIETLKNHLSQFAFLRLNDISDDYSSEIEFTNSVIDFAAYGVEPYPYGLPFIELKNTRLEPGDMIKYRGGTLNFTNNTIKNYLGRASLLKYSYWISPEFTSDLEIISAGLVTVDNCQFVGPVISQVASVLNVSFYANSKAYTTRNEYSFKPSILKPKPLLDVRILNSFFDKAATSILNENIISIRMPYVNDFDPLSLDIRGNTFTNTISQKSSEAHKILKSFMPQIIPNYIILPLTINWKENIENIRANNQFAAKPRKRTVAAYASYPVDTNDSNENIRYRMLHSIIQFQETDHSNPFVNMKSFSVPYESQIELYTTIHRSHMVFYNFSVEFWDFESVLNHYLFIWSSENIVDRTSFIGLSEQLTAGPALKNLNVPTQEMPFEECKQIRDPEKGFGIKCILHGHDLSLAGDGQTTTHISLKDASTNQKLFTVNMDLTDCAIGDYKKHSANTFLCEICPSGFYTLNSTGPCQVCPKNFDCHLGGKWILPKEGYWRNGSLTDQAHKCKLPKNCPFDYNEKCLEGTTGPLCDSCDLFQGYVGQRDCTRCPSISWITINLAITILLSFAYQLYLSFDALSFNQSLTDNSSEAAVVKSIKSNGYTLIIANYFQIISLLSLLHIFSWNTQDFSSIQHDTHFKIGLYFNLECLLLRTVGLPENPSEELTLYYYKTAVVGLLPWIKLLMTFCFFSILKRRAGWKGSLSGALVALFIVTFITEQPELVHYLMPYLQCIKFPVGSRIPSLLLYTCESNLYFSFRNLFALPTLFLWALGIPLLFIGHFWFSKKDLTSKGMLGRYGQIYGSYRKERYYWFFVSFLQVTLIVSANWIFNDYDDHHAPKEKGLLLCLIFFAYREAVSRMKPYTETVLNQTDKFSNIAYFSTLFLAIFSSELKKGSKYSPISGYLNIFCEYGLVVVNILFVGMIIFRFGELYTEELKWASENVKPLKHIKTRVQPVLNVLLGSSNGSAVSAKNEKEEVHEKPDNKSNLSNRVISTKDASISSPSKHLSSKKKD